MKNTYKTIGLMSGTSLDGIDAALLETDGESLIRPLEFATQPYERAMRGRLRAALGQTVRDRRLEKELTLTHAAFVKNLGWQADLIGFHGQTIFHNPKEGITGQIGDGGLLARKTGMDVVNDFRSADVKAGGQGAPFLPLYHQARVRADGLETPVAVLNIGGVANVTWIGPGSDEILAFDTGPGNALIDDFVSRRTGAAYDKNGALAEKGSIQNTILHNLIRGSKDIKEKGWKWKEGNNRERTSSASYFNRKPPKSLDRNEWTSALEIVSGLSTEDGAATLSAFTVEAVRRGKAFFPEPARRWLVAGGGRYNRFLMQKLREALHAPVQSVEVAGWNGDALEAEGFAWLAVRSVLGLPLSLPSTTGVSAPQTGGTFHKASG